MSRYKTVILALSLSLVLILFSFTFLKADEINSLNFSSNFSDSANFRKDEKISLTLQKAIEIALAKNKGILIIKEKVKESEQSIRIARSAYFPSLDLSSSYTHSSEVPSFNIPPFGTFKMGEEDNYTTSFSLTQPLYTSGRINLGYKQAKISYQKAKENLTTKKNEVIFKVKKAFYSALLAKENLNLVKEAQRQAQRHLNAVEGLYHTGRVSKFDLLTSKVEVANVKSEVIQAENTVRLSIEGLVNLLSLSTSSIQLKGEFKFEPMKISLKEAIEKALSHNSDINSLKLQENMAIISLQLARLTNKPSLSFVGNYKFSKPPEKSEWEKEWNINLILSITLFNGGKPQAIVSQRKSQLREIKLSLEQLKNGIVLQVKSAFWDMEAARQSILAQKENVGQARQALSIAESRYKNGTITNLEVLDAQLALTRAKVGYLKALYDYSIARAKLERLINIKGG